MIAVDSDDTFSKSLFSRDVRVESLFHSGNVDKQRIDEFNVDDEYDYEEGSLCFQSFHSVWIGQAGDICWYEKSYKCYWEFFFYCWSSNKGIAKENLTNENGHHILSGDLNEYQSVVAAAI